MHQFDVCTHSVRNGRQSGYEEWRPDTCPHNIKGTALRVRFQTREQMEHKLEGSLDQKSLQRKSWELVEKLIDGIPPLKEWAGEDYKVQFSMMTNPGLHAVEPHKDSADISPQFSLCLGDCTGDELLTWANERQNEPDPDLSTDVRRKLLFFDGRLKHSADTWKGSYRLNVAFYKHYDRRWDEPQPVQETPLLVMDFNKQTRK